MALVQVVNGQVVPGSDASTTAASITSAAPGPSATGLVHIDPASNTVVPGGPSAANLSNPQNASVLQNIVDNLLNTEATAVKDKYSSTANQETSAGDAAEGQAYQNAADIAASNADVAKASGEIQQFQSMRKAMQTIGEQHAIVAGAGFGNSGSALLLAQDSMRQAHLQDQIIGTNSMLQQGGFLEQSMAAKAESTAANTASSAALTLSQSDATVATMLQADANAEADAISAQFPGTPQANIAKAAASGTPLNPADLAQQAAALTGQATNQTPLDTSWHIGWMALI